MTNSAVSIRYNGWHGPEVMLAAVKYTVYIDVVFFINLFMDLLLLLFLKKIMKLSASAVRIGAAAAAGAVWACVSLFLPRPFFFSGFLGMAVSGGGMVWIAFEWRRPGDLREKLRRLGAETAGLFLTAILLGGGFSLLEGLASGLGVGEGRQVLTLGAWGFLAAGTIFLCRSLWSAVQEWNGKKKAICRVKLVFKGRETETNALIDTGNRLSSPEGDRPVHVLEYEVCREICDRVDKVIYIPYRSVGRQNGVIPGITLDRMEIGSGEERILVERPLVGIVKVPLSSDGSYRMLLNEKVGR